jgi:ABC-type transport system involved in cytochrome c biogenesis permease subunit
MKISDMVWDAFIWFGLAAVLMSAGAALFALHGNRSWTVALSIMSVIALGSFIAVLWGSLGRPPLKTMGETRLWYSFFALLSGLFTYMRWRYKWILSFSTVLATVFIVINILKPEIHDQSLMPALQSPWFIPHVTVYMFSYSLLGCAFLIAVFGLFRSGKDMLQAADTLVYIGTAFLTFGMLSGAIWAKAAWGHYWSWDPKETWALATWLSYLLYMHLRITGKGSGKALCLLLVFSFLCLQMCWWGVNYLPSAQDSIHVYNR